MSSSMPTRTPFGSMWSAPDMMCCSPLSTMALGFDVEAAVERAKAGKSMGLLGMEERAKLAGGSVRIVSEAGEGTRIEAHFRS